MKYPAYTIALLISPREAGILLQLLTVQIALQSGNLAYVPHHEKRTRRHLRRDVAQCKMLWRRIRASAAASTNFPEI